ncbi:peptidylprolyl isomerase, partial [Calditrichota bacterium]
MTGKNYLTAYVVFILLILISGCANKDPNVVAKVEDWTLSTADFRDQLLQRFGTEQRAAEQKYEDLKNILDELVIDKMKVRDAINRGMDTDPEVNQEYENALKGSAISELYKREIRDVLITPEEVKKFYENDKAEVHASHILLQVEDGADDRAAKRKIDKIRTEAMAAGADFAVLAKKYNEDKSSADGDLGWFRWGTMVDPFQQVVFNMEPGELSEPVKTQFGWHLIKLHGRRESSNLEPYDMARERIIAQISRVRGRELGEAAQKYVEDLKVNRNYKFDEKVAGEVLKAIKSKTNTGDPLSLLTEEQQKKVISSLDDGGVQITAKDFFTKLTEVNPSAKGIEDVNRIKDFCDRIIMEDYLLPQKAREKGCFDLPEVLNAAEAARDGRLKRIVQKMMVNDRIDPTDDQAKEYYEKNSAEFMSDRQFTLREILISSEDEAKKLLERIKNGEDMKELAVNYSERRRAKKKEGILGPITSKRYQEIGEAAASAKVGELVGPIFVEK